MNKFSLKSSIWINCMLPISERTIPLILFFLKLKFNKFVHPSICLGNDPVKLLSKRIRNYKLDSIPNSSWILLKSLLSPRLRWNIDVRFPNSFRICPTRWLNERSSHYNWMDPPSWGGITLEILLLEIFKLCKLWHCPHFWESSP